jgi:ubiquinone/menaquinone biosynthesis C-methylase UbiE
MLSKILTSLRCPGCLQTNLQFDQGGLRCKECGARYPLKNGILDMLGDKGREVITPFQRLMQASSIVSIYEKLWRRVGYYLASSRSFDAEMRTILDLGKSANARLLLDLACGTGIFTRPLARQEDRLVVGLDMSWPMLTHAQSLMQKEGMKNVLFIRATAFNLPFTDGAIPYVNCCGALHLFDRPNAALKEIGRVVCPGGYFSAQTTIRPNRSAGLAYFLERFIRFGFFAEAELLEQIAFHGFSLIKSERHRISFTFLAQRTPRRSSCLAAGNESS